VGVIFVCLGNICRSPAAEAVFTQCVKDAGLSDQFDIDGCGTGGGNPGWYEPGGWSYHEGEDSDPRMKAVAAERGIDIQSKSRPLNREDFNRFNYIVGMDQQNLGAIRLAAQAWKVESEASLREGEDYRVVLMSDYCTKYKIDKVPDPYYAGGFDKVLDMLQDACEGLFADIRKEQGL